ncbi:aldo/keto reductase [Bifidobacterium thermophilum]|uniref:aldo/keto reductase n=1 Tax=Bifidobacterium thermophilum TaxID=33905 RepID=UPI0030B7EAED
MSVMGGVRNGRGECDARDGRLAGFGIPRIGMGTMALAIEGRPDRETAIETIHAALDEGVRYLDTAWSYYLPSRPGTGEPEDLGYGERLVRDALASWDGPRERVLVATKTGYRRTCEAVAAGGNAETSGASGASGDSAASAADVSRETLDAKNAAEPDRQHLQAVGSRYGWMADSRPETMIRDAKESAAHLGVEALDLLYSHGPDPAVPYTDQVGALRDLLDAGVIRYAGISRVNREQIDIARSILGDRLIAVQNQFSPSHPDPEHTLEYCEQLGLAFVCWSPLGGFLDPVDQHAYDPFREVAAKLGVSHQRVTLAWELAQYPRLFTIPSARNPQEIHDSFAAARLALSPGDLARLNASVAARRQTMAAAL